MVDEKNKSENINKDEFPDKYTWGSAGDRKEFRFNASNKEESEARLIVYLEVIGLAQKSEVVSNE